MNYMIYEKNMLCALEIKEVIKLINSNDYYEIDICSKINKNIIKKAEEANLQNILIINIGEISENEYKLIKKEYFSLNPNIILYGKKNCFEIKKITNFYNINLLLYDDSFLSNLYNVLSNIYIKFKSNSFFSFSYYDEIFNLPYDSIYYIEKNINDNSISIYTSKNVYTCYKTLKKTYEELENDSRFVKISRSSIINVHKVFYYNKCSNEVCLINGQKTYLVCRSMRTPLSKKLLYSNKSIKSKNKMV